MSCLGCLLEGNQQVRYFGNLKAKIMICGESPGQQELIVNKPFIGPAGKLAQQEFAHAGLNWPECFIINSARCLIDTKKFSKREVNSILAFCRPNVEAAINYVKPKLIICLGDIALRQIFRKEGVKKHRGKFFWSDEFSCWVMVTYHPSGCLRDASRLPYLREDLRKVVKLQKNKWKNEDKVERVYLESDPEGLMPIADILAAADTMTLTAAMDSETQGMDWKSYIGSENPQTVMISYGVCVEVGKALVVRTFEEAEGAKILIHVPAGGKGKKAKEFRDCYIRPLSDGRKRAEDLASLLAHPNIKKYFCNGLYDIHHFREYLKLYGIEMKLVNFAMDVQALAHLFDEVRWKMGSLEELQLAFTTNDSNYSQEFEEKYNKNLMIEVPPDDLVKYNAADCDVTLEVGQTLRKKLLEPENKKLLNYYVNFVQPTLSHTLYELGKNGSFIDKERLPQAKSETAAQIQALTKQIMDLMPFKIKKDHYKDGLKLTRGDLIKDTVFSKDGFNLKSKFKTPKGNPRLDDEARKELLEREDLPEKAFKFITFYSEWQQLQKLYTTYLNGFEKHIKYDSRVYSSYSIVGTATGRANSARPNVQNQPKRSKAANIMRSLIAAPEGKVLVALDAAQAELRWCAQIANDEEMIRVFKEGVDIHTNTAESIRRKKASEMTKEEFEKARFDAKCFHPSTEFLTKTGWKTVVELQENEEIMQAFPFKNHEVVLDWVIPTVAELRKNHCTSLIQLSNEGINLAVTPDHRMLGYGSTGKPKVTTPDKFNKVRYWMNAGTKIDNYLEEDHNILRLVVATQADGSLYPMKKEGTVIKFGFTKKRKIERMRKLLKGFQYKESIVSNGKNPDVTSFYLYKENNDPILKWLNKDKTFSWKLLELSLECRQVILEELKYWDGLQGPKNQSSYFGTTKKENSDVVQALAVMSNQKSKIYQSYAEYGNRTAFYNTSIAKTCKSRGENISSYEFLYTDDVAVLSVPSTFVVARNGKETYPQIPVIVGQSINFGVIYRMSPEGFVNHCKKKFDLVIDLKTATQWITDWNNTYPNVRRYHQKTIEFCKEHGYVESPLGRRRRLPEINSNDWKFKGRAEKQAVNHPIQSASSDTVILAANTLIKERLLDPEHCKLVNFVHDELVFEVTDKDSIIQECFETIKYQMEHPPLHLFGIKMRVPFQSDGKVGKNLAEMGKISS